MYGEIGVLRNVEPATRPRLECRRETGLILRCDRKVGNPFQTKQGSRPSCPDQEGRRGSEEVVPENLGVPLEGDRDYLHLRFFINGCLFIFKSEALKCPFCECAECIGLLSFAVVSRLGVGQWKVPSNVLIYRYFLLGWLVSQSKKSFYMGVYEPGF